MQEIEFVIFIGMIFPAIIIEIVTRYYIAKPYYDYYAYSSNYSYGLKLDMHSIVGMLERLIIILIFQFYDPSVLIIGLVAQTILGAKDENKTEKYKNLIYFRSIISAASAILVGWIIYHFRK